jgi:cytoskeletal protein CcmA (bactofilin family)
MWGSNKRRGIGVGTLDTLVGRNTRVVGDISFSGGLRVEGVVVGNVSTEGDAESVLMLSKHGTIEGEIRVAHVVLDGAVEGDVHAEGRLELGANARVSGDVYYSLLEMAEGASVNGKLVHRPPGQVLALSHERPEPEAKTGENNS